MTLMSEITRVSNNIAAAYIALDGKGATLPAAGSQNSANLADTIDTIQTGGGGGGSGDAHYEALKTAINSATINDLVWNTEDASTINTLKSQTTILEGTSFAVGSVFIKTNYAKVYARILPSTATETLVADESGYKTYKVDFNDGNRWIILPAKVSSYIVSRNPSVDYYLDASSTLIQNSYFSYSISGNVLKNITSNAIDLKLESSTKCFPEQHSAYRETNSLSFIGDFSFCDTSVQRCFAVNLLRFDDFDYYFDNATSLTKNSIITSNASQSLFNLPVVDENLFTGRRYLLLHYDEFPFIYQFADASTTSYPPSSYYYSFYSCHSNAISAKILKARIILPSSHDVKIVTCNGSVTPIYMSDETMTYMAENAPSVSGRTLYIHTNMKNLGSSVYSSFVSALQTKGWTVTEAY